MTKYKSRATRAGEVARELDTIADKLEELRPENGEELKPKEVKDRLKQAAEILHEADVSEVVSLQEEMGNWRDNLSGTALENTNKFQTVSDAADTLENLDLEIVERDLNDFDDLENVISDLRDLASELENVEFPGMYG